MFYSITFYDASSHQANTWNDWHLIPTSRPTIAIPQPVTKIVKIPGNSTPIDLSTYLKGRPIYGPSSGSLEFYVDHDQYPKNNETWISLRHKICSFLHGKKIKMVLEEDPGHYYIGRFLFNAWKSDANWSQVSINYQLDPYRYPISGINDWSANLTGTGGVL